MPDAGLREAADIMAPEVSIGADALVLEDARVVQVTFEVDKAAAMAVLPVQVTRPLPCYGRLFAVSSSSATFASLLLGCRFAMGPRNLVAATVVDGDSSGLASAYGGPVSDGSVSVIRDGAEARVEVRGPGGGIDVAVPGLYAIDPAMLRFDGWLSYGTVDGAVSLLGFEPQVQMTGAFLSKSFTADPAPGSDQDSVWVALRDIYNITACLAEATVTLTAAQSLAKVV